MIALLPLAALGVLLAGACGAAAPPSASAPVVHATLTLDPPPVHSLIGHRTALELTSAQIEALDSLGIALHAEVMQLSTRLRDVEGNDITNERTRSLTREIITNNVQAMERVRTILNDDQRERVCSLFPTSAAPTIHDPNGQSVSMTRGPVWAWCMERPA